MAFTLSDVTAVDLSKSSHPIATGVGFFDHMIDQLNSHAQVGVSVSVGASSDGGSGTAAAASEKNRFAEPAEAQAGLMSEVGAVLGSRIKSLIEAKKLPAGRSSRFCCPLDEALVECTLAVPAAKDDEAAGPGELIEFTLPPYGVYPSKTGRTRIGRMATAHLRCFFEELARSMGLRMGLRKVRGDNGHHVVESAFKAFSRALRNLLDGTNTGSGSEAGSGGAFEDMWGVQSESYKQGLALARTADLERSTKETSISVKLRLDWMHTGVSVDTGVETLDSIFSTLAEEAKMSLDVKCRGDTWVDDHHTSEDVAIAIGQCLNKALGSKAGLNRMWCAVGQSGDAEVEVTMDLSNRPCLTQNLSLSSNACDEEYIGDLCIEMFEHALVSLVMNSQMTVHIVERKAGATIRDTAMATAKAFGRALRLCAAVDPRRAGKTASSKGTLSV